MHFGLDRQRALWFLGSMAKTFKSWDVDQVVLLPPSVQELVPAGHLAHFVREGRWMLSMAGLYQRGWFKS